MRDFWLWITFIFFVLMGAFVLCYFVGCSEPKNKTPSTAQHAFGAVVLDRDASTYYNPPEIEPTSWRE